MAPMDVTTLFGNLMENAIEACRCCQRKKDIRINVHNYNEMLSIRIENTVEWEVKLQNGSVLYRNENRKFYCDI